MRNVTSCKKMLEVVKFIRETVCRELPIQQLHILLVVANQEGITSTELCKELDMQSGSLSRNMKMLSRFSERNADGGMVVSGHDLIDPRVDLYNRKMLAYYLTSKGRQFVNNISTLLGSE